MKMVWVSVWPLLNLYSKVSALVWRSFARNFLTNWVRSEINISEEFILIIIFEFLILVKRRFRYLNQLRHVVQASAALQFHFCMRLLRRLGDWNYHWRKFGNQRMDLCRCRWNVYLYSFMWYGNFIELGVFNIYFIGVPFYIKIPEMHEAGEEIEQAHFKRLKISQVGDTVPMNLEKLTFLYKLKVMFIQNIGMIIGFALMFIMSRYGQYIQFE